MIFHQPGNSLTDYNFNINFYNNTVWENHFHKNLELIYVLKGELCCTLNSVNYKVSTGEFALCLPYDIHSLTPNGLCEYWILIFSSDFVHSFSKEILGKVGNGCAFKAAKPIEDFVKSQLIYNNAPSKYTLKSCLYAICEEYLKNIKLINKDRKQAEVIALIADYVLEKHKEKISLLDIATTLGYDYNYMSRYFKNVFNMSFTDFVNLYRLETAIELLENTDESILDIALKSGFQSLRTFNDFFKKNTNLSPSQYRKASRKCTSPVKNGQ